MRRATVGAGRPAATDHVLMQDLTPKLGNHEHPSPPPMIGVGLHAAMTLSALLLLALGYTHP